MIKPNPNIASINPYISGKPIDEVKREFGLHKIIKLASNENNWGVPKSVVNRIQAAVKNSFLYPDGSLFRLRRKLAAKYSLKSSQFIFGNGSDEILQLISLTYLNKNEEAIVSEGTFSEYAFAAKIVNAPIVTVPLKNYTYDLAGFLKKVTKKTKVIFLCNPNNPTGTYFSHSSLEQFMQNISNDVLVVIDEAYYEFAFGDDYPESLDLLKKYPNMIILRTFSKMFSIAGLRIGYGISSAEVISDLNRARQPFNVNSLAEEGALAVLDESGWIEDIRSQIEKEKEYLYSQFSEMGLEYLKSKSNFIFINVKTNAVELFQKLLAKGIIIRAMQGFGFPESIRVTVGLHDENVSFIKALGEVLS